MDPFNDLTNGFTFGTNAAGAQWDGTMYEGGKVDLNWDNKWISKVKNYDDKWILEMAIPFSSIRYKNGINKWGINFSRNDLQNGRKKRLGTNAPPVSYGVFSLYRESYLG